MLLETKLSEHIMKQKSGKGVKKTRITVSSNLENDN